MEKHKAPPPVDIYNKITAVCITQILMKNRKGLKALTKVAVKKPVKTVSSSLQIF